MERNVEIGLEDFVRLNHTGQFKNVQEQFEECVSIHDNWYPNCSRVRLLLANSSTSQLSVERWLRGSRIVGDDIEKTTNHCTMTSADTNRTYSD